MTTVLCNIMDRSRDGYRGGGRTKKRPQTEASRGSVNRVRANNISCIDPVYIINIIRVFVPACLCVCVRARARVCVCVRTLTGTHHTRRGVNILHGVWDSAA